MHTKRVIPCLDVKDGRVVKGVNFVNFRDAGDPSEVLRHMMRPVRMKSYFWILRHRLTAERHSWNGFVRWQVRCLSLLRSAVAFVR